MISRALREPLAHFLIAGCALFVIFDLVAKPTPYEAAKHIVVDADGLQNFLQFDSRTLAPVRLEDLPRERLERLIDAYVREEALYREASALGLDQQDHGFRRQLVRRLELINREVVASTVTLSEDDLQTFLAAHADRYAVPPTVTFTHVFFGSERHGDDGAHALAQTGLEELNRDHVPFHEGPSHGDRFLYHTNYVHKSADEVASHFGEAMQQELFAREPDDRLWIGPFRSPHGWHVVMVTGRSPGELPALDDIRPRVEADAFQARIDAEIDRIARDIVDTYDIRLDASVVERLRAAR